MKDRKFLVISWLKDKVFYYSIRSNSIEYISLTYKKINTKNQDLISQLLLKNYLNNFNFDYIKIKDYKSSDIYVYQYKKFKELFLNGIEVKPLITYNLNKSDVLKFKQINKYLDIVEEIDKKVQEDKLKNDQSE